MRLVAITLFTTTSTIIYLVKLFERLKIWWRYSVDLHIPTMDLGYEGMEVF